MKTKGELLLEITTDSHRLKAVVSRMRVLTLQITELDRLIDDTLGCKGTITCSCCLQPVLQKRIRVSRIKLRNTLVQDFDKLNSESERLQQKLPKLKLEVDNLKRSKRVVVRAPNIATPNEGSSRSS